MHVLCDLADSVTRMDLLATTMPFNSGVVMSWLIQLPWLGDLLNPNMA